DPLATPARMVNHAGGAYSDDTQCAACHAPSAGAFDISVAGAHINPVHASALRGLDLAIIAVSGTAGGNPVIQFTVKNHDDGSNIAPLTTANVASLSATLSGPTDDYLYENMVSLNILKANPVQDTTTGVWTAQFAKRAATDPWYPSSAALNSNMHGSFAVGLQGTRSVTLTPTVKVTEAAFNPVAYFSVDGSPVTPRRQVVDVNKCQACHDKLALHGGGRDNTEYCVLCHNPTASDWGRRTKLPGTNTNVDLTKVADHIEERSIDFKQLIHRIHTGEELTSTQPFLVYGFSGINDFGDVEFPGDRAKCETCHLPGTYTVDHVESYNLTWPIENETGTDMHAGTQKHGAGEVPIGPIRAACTACHDTFAAKAHTEAMTYQGVETCAVCHGEQADFAVTKVHAGK
ncbi:MAG TPA: hypothetical protein VMV18_04755, partial [bacterium]|nr:hypothetical protein [bacterium]